MYCQNFQQFWTPNWLVLAHNNHIQVAITSLSIFGIVSIVEMWQNTCSHPIRPPHTFLQTHLNFVHSLSHTHSVPSSFFLLFSSFFNPFSFSSKDVLHPRKPSNIIHSHLPLNITPFFCNQNKIRQPTVPVSVLPTTHRSRHSHNPFGWRWFHRSTGTSSTRVNISATFRVLPLLPNTALRRRGRLQR